MKMNGIKKFIIALLIFSLSGCILSCGYMQNGIQDSEGAWPVTEPGLEPLPEGVLIPEDSILTEEEISNLDSKPITWGPGRILDGQGRPEACVNLQSQYGKYSSWFIGEEEKIIYLTFDEGYENGFTAQILDTLKEKKVSAIFFVTMDYVKNEPQLIQRMIDEGHIVGNHTTHHPNMTKLSIQEAKQEVQELHEYVYENFGYEMTLYRAPEGAISEQSMALIQSLGYQNVLWSFAYQDWNVNQQMDPELALKKAVESVHPGAIYLFHAVGKTNAVIMDEFIQRVQDQGYKFGNWEEWK